MDDQLKEHLCVVDAKSLYDGMIREEKGEKPRFAHTVAAIKESLATSGVRPRWMPHNEMPADVLTKPMSKGNMNPRMSLKRTGGVKLGMEVEEEAYRKDLKKSGKSIPPSQGRRLP